MTDTELAKQWIEEAQDASNPSDMDGTATDTLIELMLFEPERALKIVHEIVHTTKDEAVLANVGAGPLEDLLHSEHGEQFVDDILEHARQDSTWRFALGCVWPNDAMDKVVRKKLTKAIQEYYPDGTP
jgi:hypothetical protein